MWFVTIGFKQFRYFLSNRDDESSLVELGQQLGVERLVGKRGAVYHEWFGRCTLIASQTV